MWKPQKESFNQALSYLDKRRKGEIKSIKTPWNKFNDAAVDGIEWNTITVIGGRPGCLSGETKVYISRDSKKGNGRRYTLRELFYKFNNIYDESKEFRNDKWDLSKDSLTQCYKEDMQLTGLNKIIDVCESGIKPLYEVTTMFGKKIRATLEHPFLVDTNSTYIELKNLKIGSLVACKSEKTIPKGRKKRIVRKEICTKMPYYPSARSKMINGIEYQRIKKSRLVYDANLNNLTLSEFLYQVKNNPKHNLIFSDLSKEIHHKDFNCLNDTADNLELLSIKEHHKIHEDRSRFGLNNIHLEKIVSIEFIKEEMTYDITMKSPYNNFIANGFVVHNSGKTLISDQIIREAFVLNPEQDFRVLQFQFEMLGRVQAIREYSSVIGRSYKYLCSADGTLSQEDLQKCFNYSKKKIQNSSIDVVDTPLTVDDFKKVTQEYFEAHHKLDKDHKKVYTPTIITVDHSVLFKKAPYEKDKQEVLNNLGETLTYLKKKYPVAFIILSQLNRNVDNPERTEDGKYGNYILESDIFGADALLQHADLVVGINKPAKQKIRFYGPERFIIEDENTLVFHFLKCRNGDTRMSFFKAEFEKMRVSEMPTPATQAKRINI
jgi:hypothetical protein